MGGLLKFSSQQEADIHEILPRVEGGLTRFYQISPREWFNYSYDVRTLRNFQQKPATVRRRVLAEVVRHHVEAHAGSRPDQYSILLYDPNILCHLRANPEVSFRSLMLYILTHELVHVARFQTSPCYESDGPEAEAEEARVRQLSRRILAGMEEHESLRVADQYLLDEYL